jgi:hypothetical protein
VGFVFDHSVLQYDRHDPSCIHGHFWT